MAIPGEIATSAPARAASAPAGAVLRAALGVLAGLAGVGAGQLLAAFLEPESAPLLAVGAAVVDLTPTPVKQWAISTFGDGDKVFLILVVGLVAAGLSALAGVVSRWSPTPGSVVLGALGAVCAIAAWTRPVATTLSAVPSVLAAVVAIVVLRQLLARRARMADSTGEEHALSRRGFLGLGGAAALLGVAGAATGQWIIATAQRAATIALPKPPAPLPPLAAGLETEVDGISPFQTPVTDFYRVDTALTVPAIDPGSWKLEIDGDVASPMTLTLEDLLQYEVIERDITMTCVSNDVGGPYVGSARWLGVRTSDVLAKVGIAPSVDQILSTDVDGMMISTPVQALTDGREALLAFAMNGEQLPRQHGFPVRLVTPGLYGFVGSTKWVTRLTATTYAKQTAYWTDREWDIDAPVLTAARIDTPKQHDTVAADKPLRIGGVAWAQGRGIAKVELRIDQGPWQEAILGPDAGIDYWRQWYVPWTPPKGKYWLQVRATDLSGETQTANRVPSFPGGATGWHTIPITAQ